MPSCHGTYKNIRFRSLLELSYLKFWEDQGFTLGKDVLYESIRIPYRIGNGRARDYVPDIFVVPMRLLIELKHSSKVASRMNDAKFAAAERWASLNDAVFLVMTEKDVLPSKLIELAHDVNVVWSAGTMKRRRFGKILKSKLSTYDSKKNRKKR